MEIFLIRHAHSIENEKEIVDSASKKFDDELSSKGKKEAEKLVPRLNKYKFDIVITSPLKRTKQTIKSYLEKNPQIKCLVNELTLERDAGEFTGKPVTTIRKWRENIRTKKRVSIKPKGGESIKDVYKRAKKFLNYLKKRFKDEKILICGHKNFLMCLEILLTNKKIENYYSYIPLKNKELRKFEIK